MSVCYTFICVYVSIPLSLRPCDFLTIRADAELVVLQPDSAMGPALQAAYLMMEALGGKLLLFQTSVPNVGVGKITQRDNPTLYNTDSEHRLRVPEDIFFKKFAAEASKAQISIDVFSFR